MVQVDIFWSYGLASGLTLAASRQLKNETKAFDNKYFTQIMLWIACFFAPSGMYLLWNFPGWETMFVARNHSSIPAWVVALFCITNITQAVLGYYVTYSFIRKGNMGAAKFQTIWSHACMFLVLIVGWDGSGWKRFTYAGTGEDWHNQVALPWTDFFSSPVFYTLLGMGVILIPTYTWLCRKFLGAEEEVRRTYSGNIKEMASVRN